MSDKTKKVLVGVGLILAGAAAMFGLDVAIFRPVTKEMETVVEKYTVDTGSTIVFSEEDAPVEVDEAIEVDYDIKTVDEVDGGAMQTEEGQTIGDVISARGAYYDTSTWQAFVKATEGKCVIEGNIYGAQCVSLYQAFVSSATGRSVSTCGTGAARGLWDCRDYNAGDEFELIYNAEEILPGDWVITNGGTWGHVAMAVGTYNNGYVAVWGENQGGAPCSEGGSQPNVINLNMGTFRGAFRYKPYIIPEPEPEPTPETPDTGTAYLLYQPTMVK